MSQATTRAPRARRSRKMTAQDVSLLGTRRGEPLIAGVTDGETFHLIVEPSVARRSSRAPTEQPALFGEVDRVTGVTGNPREANPREANPEELRELGLPYRFALGCNAGDDED